MQNRSNQSLPCKKVHIGNIDRLNSGRRNLHNFFSLSLVSSEMIFEALQSELSRFKFDTLSSKILKIPEFNLNIDTILYSTDF